MPKPKTDSEIKYEAAMREIIENDFHGDYDKMGQPNGFVSPYESGDGIVSIAFGKTFLDSEHYWYENNDGIITLVPERKLEEYVKNHP